MSVEIMTLKGEKYAVLPFDIYENMIETIEDLKDIAEAKKIQAQIMSGGMECFPAKVVDALVDGENPIKVYREYRGFTQAELAKKAGLSLMMIKKLESGETGGSIKTIKAIAEVLNLDVDDLI